MRSNIEEVVSQYLTMPTNYALLINGKRGTGKTFCIKNRIAKLITSTKSFDDQNLEYKFLYISLYGINSLDEIYTLMALELYPFLKSKDIQVGLGISKILLRGFLNIVKAGSVENYFIDVNDIAKKSI